MGQANELPFGFPLGDAPQGEWAETAGWLDLTEHWLTEHWLDWSFWFLVEVAPGFRPQRTGQTRLRGERLRDATTRDGRQFGVVFQSLRGAMYGVRLWERTAGVWSSLESPASATKSFGR